MKHQIATAAPVQKLIETGAMIFNENPIVLLSVSFNVVGKSLESTAYNEKVNTLLQRCYLTKEEADIMSRMGYPLHREDFRAGLLVNPPTYMGCPFFLIAFPSSMKQAAFLTVYFVASTPTLGQLDIFRYYGSLIQQYIKSQFKPNQQMPSSFELFMDDILLHPDEDQEYLTDRAKRLQLPKMCIRDRFLAGGPALFIHQLPLKNRDHGIAPAEGHNAHPGEGREKLPEKFHLPSSPAKAVYFPSLPAQSSRLRPRTSR